MQLLKACACTSLLYSFSITVVRYIIALVLVCCCLACTRVLARLLLFFTHIKSLWVLGYCLALKMLRARMRSCLGWTVMPWSCLSLSSLGVRAGCCMPRVGWRRGWVSYRRTDRLNMRRRWIAQPFHFLKHDFSVCSCAGFRTQLSSEL